MKVLRSQPLTVGAAFVLAFALRTVWPLFDQAWMYQSNGDEGVYYASASAVLHGMTPYSDFVFVHPPGILVMLAPFAALGSIFGDSTGIFLARESFVLLGSLNAALVTMVLWGRGRWVALAGGVIYASWGVSVGAEFRLNLVTAQSSMFLLALLIVVRRPRHMVLAGSLIGLTCIVKIWALPYVLVALPFVFYRYGRTAFTRFAAGVVIAPAVVGLPFVLLHPKAATEMMLGVQFDREPQNSGILRRMSTFVDGNFHDGRTYPWLVLILAIVAVAIVTPLIRAIVRRDHPRQWSDSSWLSALLVLQGAVLMSAPSFFDHYTGFVAPAGALSLALGVGALIHHWRPAVAIIPAFALASTAAVGLANKPYYSVPHEQLAAAVEESPCVWATRTAHLVVADALSSNFDNGCPFSIDPYGHALLLKSRTGTADAWDRLTQQQLAEADAVISPLRGISDANLADLKQTFSQRETFEGSRITVRKRGSD